MLTGSLVLSPVFLEPGWRIDGTEIVIHPFSLKNVGMFHPSCHVLIFHLMEYAVVHSSLGCEIMTVDTVQTFERLGPQHFLMPMFFGPAVSLTYVGRRRMCSLQRPVQRQASTIKTRWWFQRCFIFIPIPGEMIKFHYFSNGLVQPPTRIDSFPHSMLTQVSIVDCGGV